MANQTNASTLYDSYEYYLDYVDLIPVDERKLKANKCESSTGGASQAEAGGWPERLSLATSYSQQMSQMSPNTTLTLTLRDISKREQNLICHLL